MSQKPQVKAPRKQSMMALAVELLVMMMNALLELTTVLITPTVKILTQASNAHVPPDFMVMVSPMVPNVPMSTKVMLTQFHVPITPTVLLTVAVTIGTVMLVSS